VEWRPHHPELVAWLETFRKQEPAFDNTYVVPPEQQK
jgi:hypothetical protein